MRGPVGAGPISLCLLNEDSSAHVASFHAAYLNPRARGVVCVWKGGTLVIEYWRAARAEVIRDVVRVNGHDVQVVLVGGYRDDGVTGRMADRVASRTSR